jgi:hypothetical protein
MGSSLAVKATDIICRFSVSDNSRLNLLVLASEIKPAVVLGMLNIKYHFLSAEVLISITPRSGLWSISL